MSITDNKQPILDSLVDDLLDMEGKYKDEKSFSPIQLPITFIEEECGMVPLLWSPIIPKEELPEEDFRSILMQDLSLVQQKVAENTFQITNYSHPSSIGHKSFGSKPKKKSRSRWSQHSRQKINDAWSNIEISELISDFPVLENKKSDSTNWTFDLDDLECLEPKPLEERLEVLKDYEYSITYIDSRGPRRKKRQIHCRHEDWGKIFSKTWNFIDHARMHLGHKPFKWDKCDVSFTQKGNLRKHLVTHQ